MITDGKINQNQKYKLYLTSKVTARLLISKSSAIAHHNIYCKARKPAFSSNENTNCPNRFKASTRVPLLRGGAWISLRVVETGAVPRVPGMECKVRTYQQ